MHNGGPWLALRQTSVLAAYQPKVIGLGNFQGVTPKSINE
jgi:hypothetical protein